MQALFICLLVLYILFLMCFAALQIASPMASYIHSQLSSVLCCMLGAS